MEQFNAAVRALAAKAEARNLGVAQRLGDRSVAVPDEEAVTSGVGSGDPQAVAEADAAADPDAPEAESVEARTALAEGSSPLR
ncbi:Integral membrane protein [Streptomyces griseus]|nr:Integral membrane protein [Streptomyces griseus]